MDQELRLSVSSVSDDEIYMNLDDQEKFDASLIQIKFK